MVLEATAPNGRQAVDGWGCYLVDDMCSDNFAGLALHRGGGKGTGQAWDGSRSNQLGIYLTWER